MAHSFQKKITKQHIAISAIIHKTPRSIVCRFEKPASLSFVPGQFAILSTEKCLTDSGLPMKRAFSFACSPDKPYLEFCIAKAHHNTGLSAYLVEQASVGESFLLEAPYGRFFLRDAVQDIVFAAGGTGIAPLRSMIQSVTRQAQQQEQQPNISLLFACKTKEDMFFRTEFEQLPLTFLPVFTRETTSTVKATFQHAFPSGDNKVMYACGPPDFVRMITALAQQRSFVAVYKEQW